MDSKQIQESYLKFFESKGHAVIPPAPLIPPDDPTTLFTSSGMQQLVPYLKGQIHPMGKRLVDAQPCFRAEDIDEVGDNRHTTYFVMLGNWSLGDYFKKEQLSWFWQWLIEEVKLPKERLAVTVFEGNKEVKRDEVAAKAWQDLGLSKDKIVYYPAKKNWWSRAGEPDRMPPGEIGGPDSEVFFEFTQIPHNKKYGAKCHPNCDCGRWLEIGNSVFMEFEKQPDGSFKPLPKQNVDFGGGLERLTAASQDQPDIFQTDIFINLMKAEPTKNLSDNRLIADHLRASVAMINEGILPSNKKQGYILRRLIRRAAIKLNQPKNLTQFIKYFQPKTEVAAVLEDEISKFSQSLAIGKKVLNRAKKIDEALAFDIFQSYGLPFEVIEAVSKVKLDKDKFNNLLEKHSQQSRTASAGMFKGGLANQSEITTKYHTATHLLQAALRQVLGNHVRQEGSNITAERLRFDFAHPQALSEDEMNQVGGLINEKIKEDIQVVRTIEDKDKALKSGAMAFFRENYPAKVSVYTIGNFSKELCGGPHVDSTGIIGGVKLIKQESIGAGKRRIYAVLKETDQKRNQA
jgi:alanyl-tRNA synthetase